MSTPKNRSWKERAVEQLETQENAEHLKIVDALSAYKTRVAMRCARVLMLERSDRELTGKQMALAPDQSFSQTGSTPLLMFEYDNVEFLAGFFSARGAIILNTVFYFAVRIGERDAVFDSRWPVEAGQEPVTPRGYRRIWNATDLVEALGWA